MHSPEDRLHPAPSSHGICARDLVGRHKGLFHGPREAAFKKRIPVTVYFLLPEGEVENAVLLRCRGEGQQQQ